MQSRNPYAAPLAPLIAIEGPAKFFGDMETAEYGAFWPRVGALVLDSLILSPLAILMVVLVLYTSDPFLYYAVPSLAISLVYNVWLVRRFGATPGKRILKMRIVMSDGAPVTLAAATVRYAPAFVLHAVAFLAWIVASRHVGSDYDTMGYIRKMQTLHKHQPSWYGIQAAVTWIWWIGTAITLAANRRNRAIHDFVAGTVVVRTG
jgi:uncharacterized RDD family membrane protein YckC